MKLHGTTPRTARLRWILAVPSLWWCLQPSAVPGGPSWETVLFGTVTLGATTWLLFAVLQRVTAQNAWAWLGLLALTIGLVVKPLALRGVIARGELPLYVPDLVGIGDDAYRQSYVAAATGFMGFAIAVSYLVLRRVPRRVDPARRHFKAWCSGRKLAVTAFVFYSLLTLLQVRLGVGRAGAGPVRLPLAGATILLALRFFVLPALLVFAWAKSKNEPRGVPTWAAFGLLAAAGVADSFVANSKSGLMRFLLPFAIAMLVSGALRLRHVPLITAAVVAFLLFYPVVASARIASLTGRARLSTDPIAALPVTIRQVTFRVGGMDGVVETQRVWPESLSVKPLLEMARAGSTSVYFTRRVVGISQENDFRAPGMFGALLLFAPVALLAPLVAASCCVVALVWQSFSRAVGPTTVAVLGTPWALLVFAEGTFDLRVLASSIIAALVTRWLISFITADSGASSQPSAGSKLAA